MKTDVLKVKVLYFGLLRERAGINEEILEISPGDTVDALASRLHKSRPHLGTFQGFLRAAVNEEFVSYEHELHDGDEVAFIPPVAGG